MKWFTAILAIYLLLLSFIPCAESDSCELLKASNSEQTPPGTKGKHSICTPFCICSCCHNIISIPTMSFIKAVQQVDLIAKPETAYIAAFVKDIVIDFFQPPKLG